MVVMHYLLINSSMIGLIYQQAVVFYLELILISRMLGVIIMLL